MSYISGTGSRKLAIASIPSDSIRDLNARTLLKKEETSNRTSR
jgi:hypothetical protein